MVHSDYSYTVGLFRADGTALGEWAAEVDWEPAAEWARFQGIRRGTLAPSGGVVRSAIEPVWHPRGEPMVRCCRVVVSQSRGERANCDVPPAYFTSLAQQAGEQLVKQGVLRAGDRYQFAVGAYPDPRSGRDVEPGGSAGEETAPPLTLKQSHLADFSRRVVRCVETIHDGELPVLLPQEVLDETAELSRRAGELETGGVLIGHLHRYADLCDLFVEVTAQVPARHARGELMRLTFTPETWSAVRASIRLRRREEIMLGWWHSHSYLKQVEAQPPPGGTAESAGTSGGVAGGAAFLSSEDILLHRTCFPRAYSVALVVTEGLRTGLSWALFGWDLGVIRSRGFQVIDASEQTSQEPIPAAAEGEDDANA